MRLCYGAWHAIGSAGLVAERGLQLKAWAVLLASRLGGYNPASLLGFAFTFASMLSWSVGLS